MASMVEHVFSLSSTNHYLIVLSHSEGQETLPQNSNYTHRSFEGSCSLHEGPSPLVTVFLKTGPPHWFELSLKV